MAAVAYTISKVTGVHDFKANNKTWKIRDITATTGDYATGGLTVTARDVALRRIDHVQLGTCVMTGGTSGATGNPIGVTYTSPTSVTFQQYESADTGEPLLEKTDAEAVVANATFRVLIVGQ
jgi:hypothetical protein